MDLGRRHDTGRKVLEWLVIGAVAVLVGFAIAGFPSLGSSPAGEEVVAGAGSSTTSSSSTSTSSSPVVVTTSSVVAAAGAAGDEVEEPARPPREVRVRLYNGSSVGGAAVRTGNRLKTSGYVVRPPGPSTSPRAETSVYFREGSRADAVAVAVALGRDPEVVEVLPEPAPVPAVGDADVIVVVGDDVAQG